jgi:predicted ATPase/class 3 adenylate cyclase/Tfp pilus assembly protein PilF
METITMPDSASSARSTLLTFLIADIRGYTSFMATHGDERGALLAERFADLAEAVVQQHAGTLVELRGDEILAAFTSARQALYAAVDLQSGFAREVARDFPVQIGIGLDAGDATPLKGGYRGSALNLAARLQSLARDEIFVSETVVGLAGATAGLAFVDRGLVSVKGFPLPIRVFQAGRTGDLPGALSPLQPATTAPPHNLQEDATPFIGREREIEQAMILMGDPHTRLVTLTGTGGSGKTRLAIQIGRNLLEHFEDGVFFCELAPLTDPSIVPSAIAQVLDIKERPGGDIFATLLAELRDRHHLLILDNFEHLMEAAGIVSTLLDSCRHLHVIVTSRTPLHLAWEHEFAVPPLAIPDLQHLPDVLALSRLESVALFLSRARAARSDFHLTEENAPFIADIVSRLDGLPLAIELAAARIKVLPPRTLLQHLSSRLKLLTGGARDRHSRHHTLRSTIDWSYSLLADEEKILFARISVFAGGWTLESAEAVCSCGDELDIVEGMTSLVDKSLVVEEGDEEPRFRLLETIREYARERLAQSDEMAAVQTLHGEWVDRLVGEASAELTGSRQFEWLERLEIEHDNIRAALQWSCEGDDMERGLRIAANLWRFWWMRGYLREGRDWFARLLGDAAGDRVATGVRADALNGAGVLAHVQDDYTQALGLYQASLALRRAAGDKQKIAASLSNMGALEAELGHYDRAETLHEEALTLRREGGDAWGTATSLNALGNVLLEQGRYDRAGETYHEALTVQEGLGDTWGIATSVTNLGQVALQRGDERGAEPLFREGLKLRRQLGDRQGIAISLSHLGDVYMERGELERASGMYRQSFTLNRDVGDQLGIAVSLEGLAMTAHLRGQPEAAVQLLSAATGLRESIGAPPTRAGQTRLERHLASLRGTLGDRIFDELWRRGSHMEVEDLVRLIPREVAETDYALTTEPG